jgi:hypothetical protein
MIGAPGTKTPAGEAKQARRSPAESEVPGALITIKIIFLPSTIIGCFSYIIDGQTTMDPEGWCA